MGSIFVGMTDWTIDDSNGVHNYNFSLSANTFVLTSTSLTSCRNSYVWYRQETCPQYYFLTSHRCIACDISCNTCDGPLSTNCLSCTTTRSYDAMGKKCNCLTGYVDQGGRDCIQITCNSGLCRTCSMCISGYYDSGVSICASCNYTCSTCALSTSCTSCNITKGRVPDASVTYCACTTGMYDDRLQ